METPYKNEQNEFSEKIARKEKRKLQAQKVNSGTVWSGLGMFGMVGWSIAVPSLLGAALGIWLDRIYPQSFSWVLSFLMIGLITGCCIAWYWVTKEDKETDQNQNEDDT